MKDVINHNPQTHWIIELYCHQVSRGIILFSNILGNTKPSNFKLNSTFKFI